MINDRRWMFNFRGCITAAVARLFPFVPAVVASHFLGASLCLCLLGRFFIQGVRVQQIQWSTKQQSTFERWKNLWKFVVFHIYFLSRYSTIQCSTKQRSSVKCSPCRTSLHVGNHLLAPAALGLHLRDERLWSISDRLSCRRPTTSIINFQFFLSSNDQRSSMNVQL